MEENSMTMQALVTDEFSKLTAGDEIGNFEAEVEARWRLVETAWSQGVSRNLLSIGYDEHQGQAMITWGHGAPEMRCVRAP